MSFSKSRYNKNFEWEMIRESSKIGYLVIGGKGKLLKFFEKNFNPKSIISYSDKRFFNGNSYLKLGFELIKETEPGYFYFKGLKRENRVKFQKHKLSTILENFDSDLTEKENMLNNGWRIVYDCGQKVFIKKYL